MINLKIEQLLAYDAVYIAYSGGLDSHCLLHLLAQEMSIKSKLCAIHINHGFSQNANDWQEHCKSICDALDIPFKAIKLNIEIEKGESIEAAAREARYCALTSFIKHNDVLLTAHHQDDQAETFLLQLLRGAGVPGLAAMPNIKELERGYLYRPLLDFSREFLVNYAKENKLQWINDESNDSLRFNRNYIRHQIMPVLKQRWPSSLKTITRSVQHCSDAAVLLEDLAQLDLQQTIECRPCMLSIQKLALLSEARQKNLLRYWLKREGCQLPNTIHMNRILNEVISSDDDSQALLAWKGGQVRRFQGKLYALQKNPSENKTIYHWDWQQQPLSMTGQSLNCAQGVNLQVKKLPPVLTVQFRRGGEKIKPQGDRHTRSLKSLFQDWKIPPWERANIPLIFAGEELIAVANICYSANYECLNDSKGICFKWSCQ